jgi:hypothetical protein
MSFDYGESSDGFTVVAYPLTSLFLSEEEEKEAALVAIHVGCSHGVDEAVSILWSFSVSSLIKVEYGETIPEGHPAREAGMNIITSEARVN